MKSANILYIEDEPDYQTLVQRTLNEAGFTTRVAGTGHEGLAMLERQKPRLLILDLNLPDMDGFSVCELVRKNREWTDLPVLMVTVRYRAEDWLRGFSSGADDYLAKPINPPQLLERVHFCLKASRKETRGENYPEYRLVEAVRAGNQAAFGALSERYREPLVHKMKSLVESPEEAEDIVSDAFIKALENLAGFRGQASFFTWIYQIALNGVNLRHRKVTTISLDTLKMKKAEQMPHACIEPDPLAKVMNESGDGSRLKEIFAELPWGYRNILSLRMRGYEYQTIARFLRLPLGAVRHRLFEAKRILRRQCRHDGA